MRTRRRRRRRSRIKRKRRRRRRNRRTGSKRRYKRRGKNRRRRRVEPADFIICSACAGDELDCLATMGRRDGEGLPQDVPGLTWMWSLKGRLTAEGWWSRGAAECGTIG